MGYAYDRSAGVCAAGIDKMTDPKAPQSREGRPATACPVLLGHSPPSLIPSPKRYRTRCPSAPQSPEHLPPSHRSTVQSHPPMASRTSSPGVRLPSSYRARELRQQKSNSRRMRPTESPTTA
ncbi:hypothetical protein BD414DRAFT_299540 [Trametes punicea]|nr:hypothetical protein BD414DRAFT_299540 [Trametes punicea]